jgi:phosphoglycolate phosphatase-like HAD superfamily hydrolase
MPIALFDLDGTLVDSNYHHTLAWARSFARAGLHPPLWRVHRALGMGGDQLVKHVAGDAAEADHGEDLRQWWQDEFAELLDEIVPVGHARDVLEQLHGDGWAIVLASSSPGDVVEKYVELLGAAPLVRGWTTADDAERTKPEPDLVSAALRLVADEEDRRAVMIGDSTWDVIAAGKLDVPTVAVRNGGYGVDELVESGAVAVLDGLRELPDALAKAAAHAPQQSPDA